MTLMLPYPGQPAQNSALASVPVAANITAIAQSIQAFDGSQINAGSIVAGAFATNINPNTILHDTIQGFVQSGCVWSAVSGFVGTMTGGTIYTGTSSATYRTVVNGVGSHTFAASSDTYIDVDYNGNLYYQAVSNGAASPALTANAIRIAKVITNGSAITSVVQSLFDSLGNFIYNTNPNPITLGYASSIVDFSTASATAVQITGLTSTVIIPSTTRRVRITGYVSSPYNDTNNGGMALTIWDGTVGSGTQLNSAVHEKITPVSAHTLEVKVVTPPIAGSKTYNLGFSQAGGVGTAHTQSSSSTPAFILVELI